MGRRNQVPRPAVASGWTISASAEGIRIDRVLAAELDEPRTHAQRRLERGEVTIDGRPVTKSSYRVRAGEHVMVAEAQVRPAPPAPPPVAVLYADDDVAVIDKPAGLVVHPGAGITTGTLVDALRAMGMPLAAGDDPDRPGIVHRLDRGTSGVLVVARSADALRGLRSQFDGHQVDRRYQALVDGVPEPAEAVIDAPIARHRTDRTRFSTAPDGRSARSRYRVVEAFGTASNVQVRLATGRTHQVRVHLSAVGHPVCGDRVYGASSALAAELGLERPALHAAHLGFTHPRTGEVIQVDAPLPDDLARALERLRADLT